jgi:NAD(P)-dependent dehydrogenase (short-subunit alcohol dehydrogenase family)
MPQVIVVVGAGSIGQAIARRVGYGKQVLLADLRQEAADEAAKGCCQSSANRSLHDAARSLKLAA